MLRYTSTVCKKTWNWRTSETLADTTLVAAKPSSSWSLEVGCRRRRAESSRHAHETIARSQDSRVVRTCWSKMVAAITMTAAATADSRSIVWSRPTRTKSVNAERQRARFRSKGQVLEWHRVTQRIWTRRGTSRDAAGVKRQQQLCLRRADDS